jgi:hypothetical protein
MMKKRKKRSVSAVRRARRRLYNRLFPALQLDLFVDRGEAALAALAELEAALKASERELAQMTDQPGRRQL